MNSKRSSLMRLAFTHICYIIEVMQKEAKAHFTIHFFKDQILKHKGSNIDMYYLEVLQRRLYQQFQGKIQKPTEFFNVLNIIDYDNNIARCKYILYNQLQNIRMYYDYLCNHTINLNELYTKSIKLIQQNQYLIENFQSLFSINPDSIELQFLSSIYTNLLDYENRKFQKFIHMTPIQKSSTYLSSLKQYFQNDSCVVYSTFMKNIITIQKVSKQFEVLFKFQKNQILDKTINFLIPQYFQADHEDILDIFRNRGHLQIVVKVKRLIFAQDGKGFLLPLYILLKVENQINDFGISALFNRVDTTKDYIFLREDNQILDMTENIFKIIFSATKLSINQLRQNYAIQFIPLLWITEEAKEYGIEYNTLMVVCQPFLREMSGTQYSSLSKRKQVKELLFNVLDQTQEASYYNISFKHSLYHLSQLDRTYKYIEINYIHEEKNHQSLELSLHYLTRGLNDLIAKNIIQSKESTQLRLFKKRQDIQSTHTITNNCDNQQSHSDWDTPKHLNSIQTTENKIIKRVQRKSFLSTYATQNNKIEEEQPYEEQNQVEREPNTQRELNVINTDLSIFDQTQRFINRNEQTAENSYQINHIELQNKYSDHLNFSSRDLIPLNQEPIFLSPLYQQQQINLKDSSPKKGEKGDKNNFQMYESSKQKYNLKWKNSQLEKQLRKKQIKKIFSAADLKKMEEDYIQKYQVNNSSQMFGIQDQLNEEMNSKSVLDFNYNQYDIDNQGDEDDESINSQKSKNEIDFKYIGALQVKEDTSNQLFSKEKINLRRSSIQQMQLNTDNNQQQDEQTEQASPTLVRKNEKDKQKRNLLSLKLINLNNDQQDKNQGKDKIQKQNIYGNDDENITVSDQYRFHAQIIRTATQSSKISSSQNQKMNIIMKIKSQKVARFLIIMKFIFLLSLFVFLLSTFLMYFNSQNSLQDFQDALVYIDMPLSIVSNILKIIKSTTYYYLIKVAYDDQFDDKYNDLLFQSARDSRQDAANTLQIFTKLYSQLHDNQDYSDKTVVYLTTQYSYLDFFTFGLLSQKQIDCFENLNAHSKQTKNMNYLDLVTQFYSTMYKFITSYDEYIQEALDGIKNYTYEMSGDFLWLNLPNFTNQMYDFKQFVSSYVQNSFQDQEDFQIYVMIIILVVCCLSIFSLIPLSITKQYNREKILRLFGCFHPELLNKQILNIDEAINQLDQKYNEQHQQGQSISNQAQPINFENTRRKSRKQTKIDIKQVKQGQVISGISLNSLQIQQQLTNTHYPFSSSLLRSEQYLDQSQAFNQRINNKRNRQIASFKGLKKIQLNIIFVALIVISILMVQPVVTIFLTKNFINEQRTLIDEKSIILQTLEQVVQNEASHFAVMDFIQRGEAAKKTIYFQHLTEINETNNKKLQNLSSLVSHFSQSRRNSDLFEKFYKQLLNGDICQIQQQFKQFFTSNYTQNQCNQILNSILQRGLIISTKQSFDIWQEFYNIYEVYDSEDLNEANNILQGQLELIKLMTQDGIYFLEINDLNNIIISSLEAIIYYQNIIQTDYGKYIKDTQKYLLISQIITILLIFSLGWLILFKLFNKQMVQTKQIFTLFHIDILAGNNFIVQYFKDNNFGIK